MSYISANNIDRKLIIVSMPIFSGSRNPNVAIIWVCGGCGSHFQNGRHEFSMSHISANNIDRKLIFVSLSLMSGPQHPNMVIILVFGGLWQPFSKWPMRIFNVPYLGEKWRQKLNVGVNIYVFRVKEAKYEKYNMPVTDCFFKMAATLISVAITSMQNNYMFLFVVSAVVYSYEAPFAMTLNTIIQFHMLICNINDLCH